MKQERIGIDLCLSNGKRVYEDAETLYNRKRYHMSIPLYILSYEELCKARFLGTNFVKGREIDDTEFEKLRNSAKAHTRKILIDALAFSRMLESETDEQIEARRKFATQTGAPFTALDRQSAIELNKKFRKLFGKLHDLKMAMLYVDFDNDEWLSPKRFNENKLREVCEYLRHEVIRVFHEVRENLFLHANQISADNTNLTNEQIRKIRENVDFQARVKLDQTYRTPAFYRHMLTVLSIIDSI